MSPKVTRRAIRAGGDARPEASGAVAPDGTRRS